MKFTIEYEMEDRWVPYFLSMLKYMQYLGSIGASRVVALYSDGDGDFRPKFKPSVNFEVVQPTPPWNSVSFLPSTNRDTHDHLYDAG